MTTIARHSFPKLTPTRKRAAFNRHLKPRLVAMPSASDIARGFRIATSSDGFPSSSVVRFASRTAHAPPLLAARVAVSSTRAVLSELKHASVPLAQFASFTTRIVWLRRARRRRGPLVAAIVAATSAIIHAQRSAGTGFRRFGVARLAELLASAKPLPLITGRTALVIAAAAPYKCFVRKFAKLAARVCKIPAVRVKLQRHAKRLGKLLAKNKVRTEVSSYRLAVNEAWEVLEEALPRDVLVAMRHAEGQLATIARFTGVKSRRRRGTSSREGGNDVSDGSGSDNDSDDDVSTTGLAASYERQAEHRRLITRPVGWMKGGVQRLQRLPAVVYESVVATDTGHGAVLVLPPEFEIHALKNKISPAARTKFTDTQLSAFILQYRNISAAALAVERSLQWRKRYKFLNETNLKKFSNVAFIHGPRQTWSGGYQLVLRLRDAMDAVGVEGLDEVVAAVMTQAEQQWIALKNSHGAMRGRLVALVDCSGIDLTSFPISLVATTLVTLDANYPQLACEVHVINVWWLMRRALQILLEVVSSNTKGRVKIYQADFDGIEKLHEKFSPHILPRCIVGGKCHCHRCKTQAFAVRPSARALAGSWRGLTWQQMSGSQRRQYLRHLAVYSIALVVFYPMFYFRMTVHPVMATTLAMMRRWGFRRRFGAMLFVSLVLAGFTWQFVQTTGFGEVQLNWAHDRLIWVQGVLNATMAYVLDKRAFELVQASRGVE